ncbi:unnamed protein product [Scytosiphon promiscuus]
MYAPAFGRSPSREGVSFLEEEGPVLLARQYQTESPATAAVTAPAAASPRHAHTGEDEDDSLAVVFSANTGAGRAHTPQRLNRTHTPQRLRSSSILHTAPAPVQQVSREGEARRQPLGRRKQRRWENDNLLGVEKFLRGRHAHEEGEAEHLTVSHPWRSSLGDLVSDPRAAEVRESIRKGMQPTAQRNGAGGGSSKSGARRFAGGKWEDAEERFLLVERRLRDIVVKALRSSALLTFVEGLESLLEGFSQGKAAPTNMPPGLRSALASLPTVEDAAAVPEAKGGSATLLVPLGPSPFHRLLLHALCQYRKLRSRSEETSHGRIVRVTIPASRTAFAVPAATLTEFVVQTRLRTGDSSSSSSNGGNTVSQASPRVVESRCGPQRPRASLATPVPSMA